MLQVGNNLELQKVNSNICGNCHISNLNCCGDHDECNVTPNHIYVDNSLINPVIIKIKSIIKIFISKYFVYNSECEHISASILSKSLKYSSLRLRILTHEMGPNGIVYNIHPNTLDLEDGLMLELYNVLKDMGVDVILTIRTYTPHGGNNPKVDFTITQTYTVIG